jgi:hypothetical protein
MKHEEKVHYTHDQVVEFIAEYNRAVSEDKKEFRFFGRDWLRAYAYYVIQWWEMEKVIAGTFNHKKKFTINAHQGSGSDNAV